MIENEKVVIELVTYKISVHLTTGEIREHIYPMSTMKEVKEVTETVNLMTYSIAKQTWLWKILQKGYIPGILLLQYPETVYNPSHILFIEHGRRKTVKP